MKIQIYVLTAVLASMFCALVEKKRKKEKKEKERYVWQAVMMR
jgi:hypothetical protein